MPRQRLTNIAIRYQVLLEKLKAGEVKSFVAAFAKVDKATRDVLNALDVPNLGSLTRKELQSTLAQLRAINTELLDKSVTQLYDNLDLLATDAADFEAKALQSLTKKVKIQTPDAGVAYARAINQPISATGQMLAAFTDNWTKGEVARIGNIVQRAYGEGWTTQQAVQAIRGTKALNYKDGVLQTSRRNAEAVARTAIQHVASAGRMATWEANKDVITKYRWVSTLDSRTTAECRSLDGQEFELGNGPMPPVHINCRSTTVAVIDETLGLGFLDEGATRSSIDGAVSADTTYYEWLGTQSAAFQDEALGPARAALFRDGGLSANEFAALNLSKNFQPLTLDEMRTKAPLAFAKADIPPNP